MKKNFMPRSLSAQLLILWIVAMLAAHGLAVLLLNWWRMDDRSIHQLSLRAVESRLLAGYRLAATGVDVGSALTAIDLPESSFRIADQPGSAEVKMSEQEAAFSARLAERLTAAVATADKPSVRARLAAGEGAGDAPPWSLRVDMALPDGRWLRSRQAVTLVPPHWNRVLSFSLLVGMIPTALIAILFGRRIMRPLKRLTEASRRVSRGERAPLDPERGPSEVREITVAFNEMQDNIARYVNGRTQMIAAIGHDLRTPLTSLRIRAELVDDDALREAMAGTIDEMTVMVEETLNFARGEIAQESTQEVDLNRLLQDAVEAQRQRGHAVELIEPAADEALTYRCRPVSLKRALNNLIDNAARYGAVQIAVSPPETAGAELRIEIRDHGPGIPPEDVERLFEPFARLDSARGPESGGLGLGLAIARSCVRAHGGDVALVNRPEGGLSAVISLPV